MGEGAGGAGGAVGGPVGEGAGGAGGTVGGSRRRGGSSGRSKGGAVAGGGVSWVPCPRGVPHLRDLQTPKRKVNRLVHRVSYSTPSWEWWWAWASQLGNSAEMDTTPLGSWARER